MLSRLRSCGATDVYQYVKSDLHDVNETPNTFQHGISRCLYGPNFYIYRLWCITNDYSSFALIMCAPFALNVPNLFLGSVFTESVFTPFLFRNKDCFIINSSASAPLVTRRLKSALPLFPTVRSILNNQNLASGL